MCGATDEQKQTYASQSSFFQDLTAHYNEAFGKQQGILDGMTKDFQPILNAGPNQRGFSDAERNDLNTQATESTARGYAQEKEALGEDMAGRGGDTYIPSGADTEVNAELAQTAERERSDLGNKITLADYDAGHKNWEFAGNALGEVAGEENPTGAAGVANNAGQDAASTANEMAQEDNSVWQVVGGALGGIAGQAADGYAGKH